MSNVAECIALYRDDPFVNDAQYAQLIADAHERDLDAAALAEGPEPEPADAGHEAEHVAAIAALIRTGNAAPGPNAEPAVVAAYLLSVLDTLARTVDRLSDGLGLLNDLDTRRQAEVADLRADLERAHRRIDRRKDESTALSNRIEAATRLAAGRSVRPV